MIVGNHVDNVAAVLCLLVQPYRSSTICDGTAYLVLPDRVSEVVGEDDQIELGEVDEIVLVG